MIASLKHRVRREISAQHFVRKSLQTRSRTGQHQRRKQRRNGTGVDTMKTKFAIGAGVAALFAIPAVAVAMQAGDMGRHKGHDMGPVTRAEVQAKVKEHFAMLDANKDGAVTQAEFDAHRTAMKAEREKKRAEWRAQEFTRLDTDKNGQLSKEEFNAPRPDRGERMRDGEHKGMGMGMGWGGHGRGGMGKHMGVRGGEWFASLDSNKDGRVTLAEASARALEMFNKADANKDGTVTPEERRAAWQTMRGEWRAKGS
jgi:hypothetical protein